MLLQANGGIFQEFAPCRGTALACLSGVVPIHRWPNTVSGIVTETELLLYQI